MEINFVLVASGSVCTPRINHVIFTKDLKYAKGEAQEIVGMLGQTGKYFAFDLYDTSEAKPGVASQLVESYRVEIPAPVVTVK